MNTSLHLFPWIRTMQYLVLHLLAQYCGWMLLLQLEVFLLKFYLYRPQMKFAKVMFLHVSVSHSVHGGVPGRGGAWSGGPCSGGVTAPGGCLLQGGVGPGGPLDPHPRGKLRLIRSRPTPKGEIEGDQVQAHTQGGNWGGSGPGPHPRGKLRGNRSRPTPKGEIEGDQVQAHTQGGYWGGLDPDPHPRGKLNGIRSSPPHPPPPDGYSCGRYASYWNAFLLNKSFQKH